MFLPVELFAADGKAVITDLVFPSDIFDEIELFAEKRTYRK